MLTLTINDDIEQRLNNYATRVKKPIEQVLSELILTYLATEPTDLENHPADINRHAGKLMLTQDPLAFQHALRDEWS